MRRAQVSAKTEKYRKYNEDNLVDEPSFTTFCYICNINVATPFIQEHNTSKKHENYKKIFKKVFDTMSQYGNTDIVSTMTSSKKSSYYCDTCCQSFDISIKNTHETSKSHLNNQENDKIVENFAEIFCMTDSIQSNAELQRKSDCSTPDLEKTDFEPSIYFDVTDIEENIDNTKDSDQENYSKVNSNEIEVHFDCSDVKFEKGHKNHNSTNQSDSNEEETNTNIDYNDEKSQYKAANNKGVTEFNDIEDDSNDDNIESKVNVNLTNTETNDCPTNLYSNDKEIEINPDFYNTEIKLEDNTIDIKDIDKKTDNINDVLNWNKLIQGETSNNLEENNNNGQEIQIDAINGKTIKKDILSSDCKPCGDGTSVYGESIDNIQLKDAPETIKINKIVSRDNQITEKDSKNKDNVDNCSETECVEYIFIEKHDMYYENDVKMKNNIDYREKGYNLKGLEFDEGFVIIEKNDKIKVSLDKFNSYKFKGETKYCQICPMWIRNDSNVHDVTAQHMAYLFKPITNRFLRKISSMYSHCLVCNEVILSRSNHHRSQDHVELLNKIKIPKIGKSPKTSTNKKMCKVCNYVVKIEKFESHTKRAGHKYRLISSKVFDNSQEITVSEFFERIFIILLIIDKFNSFNFCNVCKSKYVDFDDHFINTPHKYLIFLKSRNIRAHMFCFLCVTWLKRDDVNVHHSEKDHVNSYKNYIDSYLSKSNEIFDDNTKDKIRDVLFNVEVGDNCLNVIDLAKELIQFKPKINDSHNCQTAIIDTKINEDNTSTDTKIVAFDNIDESKIFDTKNTIEINTKCRKLENIDLGTNVNFQNFTKHKNYSKLDLKRDVCTNLNLLRENDNTTDLTHFKREEHNSILNNDSNKETNLLENTQNASANEKDLDLPEYEEIHNQHATINEKKYFELDLTNAEKYYNDNIFKDYVEMYLPKSELQSSNCKPVGNCTKVDGVSIDNIQPEDAPETNKINKIVSRENHDTENDSKNSENVDNSSETESVEYIFIEKQDVYYEDEVKIKNNIDSREEGYNLKCLEFHGDFVIIDKVDKIKVSLDKFNSYKFVGYTKYCQICDKWIINDSNIHDVTAQHMANVFKPITYRFSRSISVMYSHCLVCNEVTSSFDHYRSKRHVELLNKIKIPKIGEPPKTFKIINNKYKKMCEICNSAVKIDQFESHSKRPGHKNRLISSKVLDNSQEITVSEFFERIFIILLIVDKLNSFSFCNVCKSKYVDFDDHFINTPHKDLRFLKNHNFKARRFCFLCVTWLNRHYVKEHHSEEDHVNSYKNYIDSYLSKSIELFDDNTKDKIKDVLFKVELGVNCLNVIYLAKDLIQFKPIINDSHENFPKDDIDAQTDIIDTKITKENTSTATKIETFDNIDESKIFDSKSTIEMNIKYRELENIDLDTKANVQNFAIHENRTKLDLKRDVCTDFNLLRANDNTTDFTHFIEGNFESVPNNNPKIDDFFESTHIASTNDKDLDLPEFEEVDNQNATINEKNSIELYLTNSEKYDNDNIFKDYVAMYLPKSELKNVQNTFKNDTDVSLNSQMNNKSSSKKESNETVTLDARKENTHFNASMFDFHKCYENQFGFYCKCCASDINDFIYHINTTSHVLKLVETYFEEKLSNFLIRSLSIDEQGNPCDTGGSESYIYNQFTKNLVRANMLLNYDELSYFCKKCDHLVWRGRALKHIFGKKHRRFL